MGVGYKELDVVLAQLQAARGTAETDVAAADYVPAMDDFAVTPVYEFTPLEYATGTFGQEANVRGSAYCDVTVNLPVIPTASSTEPIVGKFFKCCGMEVTTATNLHTYAATSDTEDWKDLTVWKYGGNKAATNDSNLVKAGSCMFDAVLTWEVGKPLMCNFTGKGTLEAKPTEGAFVSGTLTLPAVPPAIVNAAAYKVGSASVKVISGEVRLGNTVVLVKDPSKAYGYAYAQITKRASAFRFTFLDELLSTWNPWDNLDAGTLDDLSLTFGVAGSKITIASTDKVQFTDIKEIESDGIKAFEVNGVFVDNSLSIAVNVT